MLAGPTANNDDAGGPFLFSARCVASARPEKVTIIVASSPSRTGAGLTGRRPEGVV